MGFLKRLITNEYMCQFWYFEYPVVNNFTCNVKLSAALLYSLVESRSFQGVLFGSVRTTDIVHPDGMDFSCMLASVQLVHLFCGVIFFNVLYIQWKPGLFI